MLGFESFELSTSVAANCPYQATFVENETCYIAPPGGGKKLFITEGVCDLGDIFKTNSVSTYNAYDGNCYDISQYSSSVFSS